MALYTAISPLYDPLFERFYRPFRKHALEMLPAEKGSTVLDLACGTGSNFPLLQSKIKHEGKIIGVDSSSGMLRQARRRMKRATMENVSLLKMNGSALSPYSLKAATGFTSVHFVTCTYGFTAMDEWETVFHRAYSVLRPGGGFLIHDIHADKKTFYNFGMQKITRTRLSRQTWLPLERLSPDFHMEYIDLPSRIFGGRLFVAYGTKP